jgi:hypothetical protein
MWPPLIKVGRGQKKGEEVCMPTPGWIAERVIKKPLEKS